MQRRSGYHRGSDMGMVEDEGFLKTNTDPRPLRSSLSSHSPAKPLRSVRFNSLDKLDTEVQTAARTPDSSKPPPHSARQLRPYTPASATPRSSRFVEMLDETDMVAAAGATKAASSAKLRKLGLWAVTLALLMTILNRFHCLLGSSGVMFGVQAAAVNVPRAELVARRRSDVIRRATTDTDVCKRWSQQSKFLSYPVEAWF
jgi:hypothetical protein